MTGGYQIVNLRNYNIIGGVTMAGIEGLFDSIQNSHDKPLLLTGIRYQGRRQTPIFTTATLEGENYLVPLTIDAGKNDGVLTITPNNQATFTKNSQSEGDRMEVQQIYALMNQVTQEILGESGTFNEDLSNVVDIGNAIFNASAVDNYVRSLVNHIGRVIFVNRPYSGNAPSVLMDGWEYGSVLEKISADLPEAEENETWELTDGASYDPNIFYKPKVEAKFYNKRTTFEIPCSFTQRQVKESFSNATQLNGFLSMLYNAIDKSLTVKIDSLVMRTINNMIGETVASEYGDNGVYNERSGVKAVNLLYLFNQRYGTTLAAENAITDPEFIRFAAFEMGVYTSRLSKISSLFNIGGKDRFTPTDMLHVVMLADFKKAANVYLQSDVFHDNFTELPNAEEVPYWQGSGTSYRFMDISGIKITTSSGVNLNLPYILGVMFDRDALGVTNLERRVTTNYNPKAEFFTNWYKFEAGYFNDTNENFVVFFMA